MVKATHFQREFLFDNIFEIKQVNYETRNHIDAARTTAVVRIGITKEFAILIVREGAI